MIIRIIQNKNNIKSTIIRINMDDTMKNIFKEMKKIIHEEKQQYDKNKYGHYANPPPPEALPMPKFNICMKPR